MNFRAVNLFRHHSCKWLIDVFHLSKLIGCITPRVYSSILSDNTKSSKVHNFNKYTTLVWDVDRGSCVWLQMPFGFFG